MRSCYRDFKCRIQNTNPYRTGNVTRLDGIYNVAGSYSHFRETNVVVHCGLAVDTYMGVKIATLLRAAALTRLLAFLLLLSAGVLCFRMFFLRWCFLDYE